MITFTETTGILDKQDIQRKTRMWRFDTSSNKATVIWTDNDGKICSSEVEWAGGPLTINVFINQYLNPNIGRCASLNGTDNFVLVSDGSWDKPLKDDDFVGLVPAVGLWWMIAYFAVMAILLAYSIYMILTMKSGDGSASTTVYSLSQVENQKRPGQIVERQYGRLKFYPSYAANPYTRYISNKQWLYAQFCLCYGKIDTEEYGFDDTDSSNYYDVTWKFLNPNESASMFDNNILTSSEVSGGMELIPYNQGRHQGDDDAWEDIGYVGPNGWTSWGTPYGDDDGWTPWYTANPIGTIANSLMFDFEFPNGLCHTNKDGDAESVTLKWECQYRSMTKAEDGSITYGTPITESLSKKKRLSNALRYTYTFSVSNGAWQGRARRITKRNPKSAANGARTRETLNWTALRARLPNKSSYEKVSACMLKAVAQNGLTDSAAKKFYVIGTAYSPVYNTETKLWTDTPNRNPVWAICDMMMSDNGGNYSESKLDLDNLSEWAQWCDDNEVYFDYRYDDSSKILSAIQEAARVMRATIDLSTGKLRLVRDESQTIPVAVFTPKNIVSESLQIQYKGVTPDSYDGWEGEYTDEDTWEAETVDVLLPDDDGSNPKSVTLKGVTDRTKAYRLLMYERSVEMENRAAISFETTIAGWQATIGTMIYVNHPLFRLHDSGCILSVDGTTVVLDRNVKLNSEYNNIFKIKDQRTGTISGTYLAEYYDSSSGDYHTLTLDSAPDASGMLFDDPQAMPEFILGIGTAFAKKCRVTKTQNTTNGTKIECFIDTDKRFAYDSSYPDTGVPTKPPTVIPDAPQNITAIPYDPDSDYIPTDITISWDAVSGFNTYIVQYSTDNENWTTVTSSTTLISVLLGSYITGNFYARVAVVYAGCIWSWGYSGLVYMPTSLTYFAQTSNNISLDVSSDNYIDIQNS